MNQAHFLASFLFSILFLFPEFSVGQTLASPHNSRLASLVPTPLNCQTLASRGPPSCEGLRKGLTEVSHSKEWGDCREGRESRRKQ